MTDLLIAVLNSDAVTALFVACVAWALAWVLRKYPNMKKFEGSMIHAVRLAEKAIPNDTKNAGLARADAALLIVLRAFAQIEGREATAPERALLASEIARVHNEVVG